MTDRIEPPPATRHGKRRRLVAETTDRLREMIFECEPEARIGSLTGLAETLGVGIVTVQQTARILEHEGLLEVRRGPGGGYYGKRPDAAVLERSLAAYMGSEPASWEEALDMTSLLFNELAAAAAGCTNEAAQDQLEAFIHNVEECPSQEDVSELELEFQDLLFRMVDRPLFELLTRMTMRFAASRPAGALKQGVLPLDRWKSGRLRIIDAILNGDAELARFEAERNNRRLLLRQLKSNVKAET